MFDDKNNIDLMMRSVLEGAEEEVPACVWEGVSAGLDKATRGKVVALWFRRVGAGVAVAAAAVAAMLLVQPADSTMDIVPASDEMIAVAEPVAADDDVEAIVPERVYVAQARPVKEKTAEVISSVPSEVPASEYREAVDTEEPECTADEQEVPEYYSDKYYQDALKELEGEIVDYVYKRKVSFTISGLTGTNAAQNESGKNIFKRPVQSSGSAVTGVKQTSTNSTYDIPLSFGAGVRVGISPKWSIGAGVNYSMLSRKFYGTYTQVNEAGTIENLTSSDIRNTQHYIGIPVNAYYDIIDSRKVNFYAYAGGTVEKCMTDRYEVISTSIVHKEKVKGVQWSTNLGIGVSFKLGEHLGLYIDPSLRYYFDCGQPHNIRAAQPLMLGFEVGLKAYL